MTDADYLSQTDEDYSWDHRNRLTKVELYDAQASLETTVYYAYDHNNRLYQRTVDGDTDSRQIFVRDDDHIVMELADDNTGDVTSSDINRRVLWLPGSIDHCLAEEIDGGATYWTLLDHLNTVQDIVTYSLASHETTLAQHNQFNSFGVLISTPTVETIALWTGRLQDYLTKKQSNRERWYDALLARWVSEDPIGFQAGDVNLYRYVGNGATTAVDPFGLWEIERNGFFTAKASTTWLTDTIEDLANEIGLDAYAWKKWLTMPDGSWAHESLAPGVNEATPLKDCPTFRVPNTIFSASFMQTFTSKPGGLPNFGKYKGVVVRQPTPYWKTFNAELDQLGFYVWTFDNEDYGILATDTGDDA